MTRRIIKHLVPIEVKPNADALAVPGSLSQFEELPNAKRDVINRPRRGAAINGDLDLNILNVYKIGTFLLCLVILQLKSRN